jgi:stage II sporulation protein D
VKKTKRKVVKHRGKVAITYFNSTSGGKTESVEHGFPGANPSRYLKSVKDPWDRISPVHTWRVTFSDKAMESRLKGLFQGNLQEIKIIEQGDSPRIVTARVVGSTGSSNVSGPTLRARLGLRSTWASFTHK